ncbi:MAG: SCO family protein [Spirochaetes bacterium]|nr:SCO family protein [Spirochaetota bacterium]MBX3723042.1 SCO family protein [Turneriella sp.]
MKLLPGRISHGLLTLILGLTWACGPDRIEFSEMPIGSDAELMSDTGKREKLSASFKPATFLFFGFSRCPDFCPMTLHRLDSLLANEPALKAKFRLLFVSVDSENEKPENLRGFLSAFPYARGYMGSKAEIAELEKKFGAYSAKETKGISHSLYLYVLNPAGKVIYLLRHDDPPEKILGVIRQAAAN